MNERERIVVLVEGRDGAGKTSLVRGLAEAFPGARSVSMPRPTEPELRGDYFERYLAAIARGPGMLLFDRSWYSRVGTERVMGFCSEREVSLFFDAVPRVEAELAASSRIVLVKIYLDVSEAEQARRIMRRAHPTALDLAALQRAGDYRRAAAEMLLRTSTPVAPWHVIGSDGDAAETLALASAHVRAAIGEREVVSTCSERSCSSVSVSSTNEEGSSASRS
jgi:polyphosphate kinase